MLKEKIGKTAGDIWNILKQEDDLTISFLSRRLSKTPASVNQALGWLAREGKIDIMLEGTKTIIRLVESEKNR